MSKMMMRIRMTRPIGMYTASPSGLFGVCVKRRRASSGYDQYRQTADNQYGAGVTTARDTPAVIWRLSGRYFDAASFSWTG
jgi:hypothetical protein